MNNKEWLEVAKAIDVDEDINVSDWEADFLESILTQTFDLTLDRMKQQYLD